MKPIGESQAGYPEEQPSEGVEDDDESTPQEDAKAPESDRAPDNDDGTATGNPASGG